MLGKLSVISCRLSVVSALWSFSLISQNKEPLQIRYANTITKDNLKKHLSVLASDEYEGRETGEKGQKMAANYIAAQFKEGSVRPGVGDTSYFQRFPLDAQYKKEVFLKISGKDFAADKNYLAFYGLSAQTIDGKEIVFAGYGIEDVNYSDYKKTSVENKVVMVFDEEPMGKDSVYFTSKTKKPTAWSTGFRKKEEIARNKNARALLIIVANIDSAYKQYRHRIEAKSMKLKSDSVKKKERIPVVFISKQMANIILAAKGADINKWEERIISKRATFSKAVKTEIKITIVVDEKTINSENVLGYIEGSDLKEELVVLTAHYDHLGVHEGKVYNGADDDGSGTVSVVELSKAFALAKKNGAGPRRSILFMTVAGEEKGLLGSEYYTQNPVFPMTNTVVDLNIDMIGRVDERHKDSADYIYIIGADKLSSELNKISEDANKQYCKLALDYTYNDVLDANRFYYRSDHYNFVKKNVPVIFYFNGTHVDYHQETDEISKINFELMEKRARLIFYTAWELANRNERIKVDVKQ